MRLRSSSAPSERNRRNRLGSLCSTPRGDGTCPRAEPLRRLVREADALERRVSDLVNAAYGLTPAEEKLMWDTAPPRMPVGPPAG